MSVKALEKFLFHVPSTVESYFISHHWNLYLCNWIHSCEKKTMLFVRFLRNLLRGNFENFNKLRKGDGVEFDKINKNILPKLLSCCCYHKKLKNKRKMKLIKRSKTRILRYWKLRWDFCLLLILVLLYRSFDSCASDGMNNLIHFCFYWLKRMKDGIWILI